MFVHKRGLRRMNHKTIPPGRIEATRFSQQEGFVSTGQPGLSQIRSLSILPDDFGPSLNRIHQRLKVLRTVHRGCLKQRGKGEPGLPNVEFKDARQ